MMILFLRFELQKISKYFKTTSLAKSITALLFIGVFLCVGVGLYYFFLSGFRFINQSVEEEIRQPLSLFIYELFLLVMAGVIIFSTIVSSIFTLFRGQYDNWLISSPGYIFFPRLIFIKSLFTSSWPLFVMFLPAILAFIKIYHAENISILFILISVILLLIFLNALSLLLILCISYSYQKITEKIKFIRFTFGGLILFLLLVVLGIGAFVWKSISTIDLVQLFKADNADITVTLQNIGNHFMLLPTHPLALEISMWQNNQIQEALVNVVILFLSMLLATYTWWKVSFLFYPLWQKFQEGATTTTSGQEKVSTQVPYYFFGNPSVALIKKEMLISRRNLKGILWSLFLMSLWLAQIGTNIVLRNNIQKYQTDITEKIAIFQAIQFIIAVYFICSFALRFVFPSFSVEKKTAWILGTAPLSFKKIFFSKYIFYTSSFLVLGSGMSYISASVLHLPFTYTFYSMSLFITTTLFIVTLSLSLGALFPSKETDDPEIMSTSMSGLFLTALSLSYGALSAWILYITLIKSIVLPLYTFIGVTFLFIFVLLRNVPHLAQKKSTI